MSNPTTADRTDAVFPSASAIDSPIASPIASSTGSPIAFPISRRALLGTAVAASAAIAIGGTAVLGTSNAFAAATASTDFLRLSEFLTGGKPLEAGLAARYQASLARLDPKFAAAAAELQRYVSDANAPNIDALLARPDLSAPLRKTITQVVSAWYLGIVNNDTDVELISYAGALMYQPTADVLVIPSYGGGPDSWGAKPANLSTTPNKEIQR
ncbi:sugar dehydrogenase complex small subunit [soil metagenome]